MRTLLNQRYLSHKVSFSQLAWSCCVLILASLHLGCSSKQSPHSVGDSSNSSHHDEQATRRSGLDQYKPQLSDYGLFRQPLGDLKPADGVIEYELNTPLFSDYSQKQRLIKLPPGSQATYKRQGPFEFPVGTLIAKTFYYSADLNDPLSKRHLVETRIMEHREDGWVGIPYVWNDEQTEAQLAIAGDTIEVSWKHVDGESRTNLHAVPNLNDCKRCHTNLSMQPIGPKANNLNRRIGQAHSGNEDSRQNQLAQWSELGILKGLPELAEIPRLAVWDDTSLEVDERARAYLDVNCAHCHNADGPARNSGLHLNVEESDRYHLGTFKTPIAAGKGTGGRLYNIVPGKPDESIMEYRMRTTKPGEIMPEFGKSLVHVEGLALVRQWILEME